MASRNPPAKVSAKEKAIMRVIRAASPAGLRAVEIASKIGLGPDRTRELLRHLRDRGMADSTSDGSSARWTDAATAKAVRAEREKTAAAERARLAEARRRERRRDADRRRDEAAAEAANEDFLVIRRSIVPANQCAPLRPAGPPSIFQMRA